MGKSHYKWSFSIAMLNYQRVHISTWKNRNNYQSISRFRQNNISKLRSPYLGVFKYFVEDTDRIVDPHRILKQCISGERSCWTHDRVYILRLCWSPICIALIQQRRQYVVSCIVLVFFNPYTVYVSVRYRIECSICSEQYQITSFAWLMRIRIYTPFGS